jgi:GGDEF domain-containing protein
LGESEVNGPSPLERMIALDGLVMGLVAGAIAAWPLGLAWVLAFVAAALVAAVARIIVTVAGGRSLLDGLRRERRVDPLTGLGNRRALIEHLERVLNESAPHPSMLAVFSLDGLQYYEETYGGMASDAMVRRLGRRLFDVAVEGAHAFRPAGGRFAIVQPIGRVAFGALVAAATATLSEDGSGFRIDALAGVVLLPDDASTAEQALLRADQRLMAQRESRDAFTPPSLKQLVADAVARRREPLSTGTTIGELARSVAGRLGLSGGLHRSSQHCPSLR